jgi:hypothetical protein
MMVLDSDTVGIMAVPGLCNIDVTADIRCLLNLPESDGPGELLIDVVHGQDRVFARSAKRGAFQDAEA